jgi:hypothetical protein
MTVAKGERPIFIVGAQRSGTTAIALALADAAAQGGGLITVNGMLPYYLKRWWMDDPTLRHLRADEVTHGLRRRSPYGQGSEDWLEAAAAALDRSARRVAKRGSRCDAWQEAREVCLSAYGHREVWGDKYNEYLLDMPYLQRLFPGARWVFIARNPHSVVRSMLGWSGARSWNPTEAAACAEKWVVWNSRWLVARRRIPRNQRLEILYEEICDGAVIPQVSDFLGFDTSSQLGLIRPPATENPGEPMLPADARAMWSALLDACAHDRRVLRALQ